MDRPEKRTPPSWVPLALLGLLVVGCTHPPSPPSLTRDIDLEAYQRAVRFKNPATVTVVALANQYLAAGRDADAHAFFCERASQVPDWPAFEALCGLFQVRMAPTVSLLQRSGWVKEGMGKLDHAAATDGLSRYLRGLVSAELPAGFGRATQAKEDLEWTLGHPREFPPGIRRAAYLGLAHAERTLGNAGAAQEALARAGGEGPALQTGASVNPRDGYRFSTREVVEVAPGVYVAHGYDFADIAFVVTGDQVVAIDAGTSEANARAALAAFRKFSDKPLRTVIVTHAHWDHIGGLGAFVGPGSEVIAQARFAGELEIANRIPLPLSVLLRGQHPGPAGAAADPDDLAPRGDHHRRHPVRPPSGAWRGDRRRLADRAAGRSEWSSSVTCSCPTSARPSTRRGRWKVCWTRSPSSASLKPKAPDPRPHAADRELQGRDPGAAGDRDAHPLPGHAERAPRRGAAVGSAGAEPGPRPSSSPIRTRSLRFS